MTAQLSPLGVQKFYDNNGNPLSFGFLYSYAAGTTTPQATYVDSTQTTPNTNPVQLNFRGECPLWLDPTLTYKFLLTDSAGNTIPNWPVDNVPGSQLGGFLSLNLVPNPTNTYNLGSPSRSWANLYLGPNSVPAFDTNSGNVGYYARTAAEISAATIPSSPVYPPGQVYGATLDVRRFMTPAQIASAAAMDGLVDHTAAIQAANDFLEGRNVAGTGGSPHVGGRLYFPSGLYNISSTVRVGGHVEWSGEEYYGTVLNVNSSVLTGTLIKLGPDESGFFAYNNVYSFGSGIRNMRISLQANNQISVVILSVGAAQFSFLENVEIDNVNQYAIDLTGPGGPAYFSARQIQISGGTTDGLPTDREGFRISTGGGFVSLNEIAIEGAVGHNFNIGIRSSNDNSNGSQLLVRNIHTEQVTDGIYFDTGGTNATSLIEGWSGNSSCTNLIHIPTSYTGTVTAIAINGLTGSAGSPIAIKNDVTGESYANFMSGVYSWSGVPGVQVGSFAASILHNTPHIRYGKSATQAIAQNTLTLLTYPTKVDDWQTTSSEWSGSRYTPKIPGRYRVSVSVGMANATWAAGQNLEVALLKNGSTFSINSDTTAVGTFIRQIMLTDTVFLNGTGDYVEAWVFQAATASLNTDSNTFNCFIAIDRE